MCSVLAAPDDPHTTPLIRDCTKSGGGNESMIADVLPENQKRTGDPFRASLESAPACVLDGAETLHDMQPTTRGSGKQRSGDIVKLLKGMRTYFAVRDNCDGSSCLRVTKIWLSTAGDQLEMGAADLCSFCTSALRLGTAPNPSALLATRLLLQSMSRCHKSVGSYEAHSIPKLLCDDQSCIGQRDF